MDQPQTNFNLSPTLVNALKAGECVLVAGPLAALAPSDYLGPPCPARLALELAGRMSRPPDNYELSWVAHLYAKRESQVGLRSFVRERLANTRYRPTLLYHLMVQLPFKYTINTAQDSLLRAAYRSRNLRENFVLPNNSVSYVKENSVIQIFGSVEDEVTLRLTEDERRRVFDESAGLSELLRTLSRQFNLLFLGFTVNDPDLMDLYYRLRPQNQDLLPRAFLVGPGCSPDYDRYWQEHNATLYDADPQDFIVKLAEAAGFNLDLTCEDPPVLNPQERDEHARIKKVFGQLSRMSVYAESGAELRRFPLHLVIQMQVELGNLEPVSEAGKSGALGEYQQGNIEWSLGNLELAKKHFDAAIQRDTDLMDARLSLYYLLVEIGNYDEALIVYQQILQQDPGEALLPERYEIRQILGQMNLGVSYCVFDQEQDKLLTITILRRALAVQEELLAQFDQQIRSLESDRIARYYGFNRFGGNAYVLCEYVEGLPLRHELSQGQPLPYKKAMQIAGHVATALEDGHSHGVPHLCLDPDNIVLGHEGLKLVNYGLSQLKWQGCSAENLLDGERSDYLSPEQLKGQLGDERSDIYALGTILYEMLTGHTPGVGKPEAASETIVEATEAVDVLIDHARERYPEQRFAHVKEISTEINRVILAAMRGRPAQYLRAGLAWVSRLYERIGMGKALWVTLPVLAVLLVISLMLSVPVPLSLATRILFPLLAFSLLVSVPVDWAVRAVARRRGLGSLIAGGRGMGAILGFLFTLDLISVVGFDYISMLTTKDLALCKCSENINKICTACALEIVPASSWEVLTFYAAVLALVLFLTAFSLGIILLAGHLTQRFWQRYPIGFYGSFVALVLVWLLLTILRQPVGILE